MQRLNWKVREKWVKFPVEFEYSNEIELWIDIIIDFEIVIVAVCFALLFCFYDENKEDGGGAWFHVQQYSKKNLH